MSMVKTHGPPRIIIGSFPFFNVMNKNSMYIHCIKFMYVIYFLQNDIVLFSFLLKTIIQRNIFQGGWILRSNVFKKSLKYLFQVYIRSVTKIQNKCMG